MKNKAISNWCDFNGKQNHTPIKAQIKENLITISYPLILLLCFLRFPPILFLQEEFEDTKGVIRIRKLKKNR